MEQLYTGPCRASGQITRENTGTEKLSDTAVRYDDLKKEK